MEMVTKIIGILGIVGSIRGAFVAYSGYEDYFLGKKNENSQQQDKGQAGMLFGAVMMIVSGGIATYIVTQLGGISF